MGTIDELCRDDDPWISRYFGGPRGRAAQARSDSAENRG
jgi:ABC-type transporter Mla maintaining outer membrane lipid asymmetry ATPase subunit MlaF